MKSLAFVLISLLFASCKSNYALFQETSSPRIARTVNKTLRFKARELKTKEAFVKHEEPLIKRPELRVPAYFPEVTIKHKHVAIPKLEIFTPEKVIVKPDPAKVQAKKKRKRKRQRFWRHAGSNLVIGVVFLGVAVGFTVLGFESLALLFGIASILFLIFGLKKVFKKRRLNFRNPFKRDE